MECGRKGSGQLASHFSAWAPYPQRGICRSELSPLPVCPVAAGMLRSLQVGWAPGRLGDHTGGAETTSWPTSPHRRHPPFSWTSAEASSLPLLTLWPLPFIRTQQTEWVFKNVILLVLFPCCFTHQWLPVVPRINSKRLPMTYSLARYLAGIHWGVRTVY